MAARIAMDQIIDLSYTLMYLGVPVTSKIYMFGDNKYVADSASIPSSTLSKKSLSLHIIESEKPLQQVILIQLERWKTQPSRHSQQTSGVCKHLASTTASTHLAG